MQLSDLANQHNLSLESLQIELLNEFPDVEEWDEIPDRAMPLVQELLNKAPEIKEMAQAFALPAANDTASGNGHVKDDDENGHLPESEALTIAEEYGVSLDFVYAVRDADLQIKQDAEIEFQTGIAEAELLIAAKEAGKAVVYEAHDENRHEERIQKLQYVEELKTEGLRSLYKEHQIVPQERAKKASERTQEIEKKLAAMQDGGKSFFSSTKTTNARVG